MSSLTEIRHGSEAGAETIIALLVSSGAVVPNPAEVLEYLTRCPDTIPALPDYMKAASGVAPEGAQLSLELYRDPEIQDEHLVLYIRQSQYQDDLMDRIDAARESLARELKGDFSGWIHITTDFRHPQ